MEIAKHTLPTIKDIQEDNPDAFGQGKLKTIVNQKTPTAWIKKHPLSGVAYVPVEKVEYLLDKIFARWKVEIKSIKPIFNAIEAEVRLWYWNPNISNYLINGNQLVYDKEGQPVIVYGEWDYHDGVGAMPVQTDKGTSAADLGNIKSDAVSKAAPAAVSYAIKDAADHIGIIFGRNVSRKDSLDFVPTFTEDPYGGPQPTVVPTPTSSAVATAQAAGREIRPETPAPVITPVVVAPAPAVVIDTAPPVFEADFFAPIAGDDEKPYPTNLNQEIDF